MRVKEMIDVLKRFDPDAPVRLSVSMPGRVIQSHEQLWVCTDGRGPIIQAALGFAPFQILVGCGIEQVLRPVLPSDLEIDLGEYDNPEEADRVRDFYVYHRRLDLSLGDPSFDYENWIPPRTRSGQYNQHIADILRERLSGDDA